MSKKHLPELYNQRQLDAIERHIIKYFGNYPTVFHEIDSPDIHVDICIVEPTAERNYYTLVTMGMGAHQMNIPKELRKLNLDRAELLITLPSDWDIKNEEEKWYWPIRWLKLMARLPIEHNTWLGWGHTVPNGEPFAENTGLSSILLINPVAFTEKSFNCKLPHGEKVNFYQMIPLYEEELNFKIQNNTESLLERFYGQLRHIVDINRKNYCDLS